MAEQNKDQKTINSIAIPGLHKILREQPAEERKYFADMKGDEVPLEPLPPDPYEDAIYTCFHVAKCSVCNSPFRTLAEHVYLANGESAQAVAHFFMKYYGVRVNPAAVNTHMNKHCGLKDIIPSGLDKLRKKAEEIEFWRLRRSELVLTGLLSQIDRIEAIRANNNPDLELKKSAEMRYLLAAYDAAQKKFEEEANEVLGVQHILADIVRLLESEGEHRSKELVRNYVKELRAKIRQETI